MNIRYIQYLLNIYVGSDKNIYVRLSLQIHDANALVMLERPKDLDFMYLMF